MFTINNKEYENGKLTFGDLVKLEEQGFNFQDIEKMTFKAVVVLMAVAMKCDIETATKEINEHLENGGDFELMINIINTMIEESAFFKSLRKTEKTIKSAKTTKTQKNG